MAEIGLVSCTKSKREDSSRPADLYSPSNLFSKAKNYCQTHHDTWYILSAEHHLLEPDGPPVEPYDKTLTGATVSEKEEWAKSTYDSLDNEGLLQSGHTLVFHAGKAYYEELLPLLENDDVRIEKPLDGLMIGERLSWYNERL